MSDNVLRNAFFEGIRIAVRSCATDLLNSKGTRYLYYDAHVDKFKIVREIITYPGREFCYAGKIKYDLDSFSRIHTVRYEYMCMFGASGAHEAARDICSWIRK